MHYALPSRKPSSKIPPYSIQPKKRIRPRFIALTILGAFAFLYILIQLFGHSKPGIPSFVSLGNHYDGADVLLVTSFKDGEDDAIKEEVIKNRKEYAKKHGYDIFITKSSDYSMKGAPLSWAKIPAIRHAMTLFPGATYFFYLDPHALIVNMDLKVETHIMEPSRLESLMITDVPIVPPDSVIKTFAGLKGDRVDFVLTQDKDGLSEKSFILRRGDWARYLLDAWFDPLYRTYNFQKAERHALEHIIQWHGTVLAKLALVPQNVMNSYHQNNAKYAHEKGVYKDGDFVLDFGECDEPERNCLSEMQPYFTKLNVD